MQLVKFRWPPDWSSKDDLTAVKNLICRSRKMRLHSITLQLSEPSPRTTGNSWKVRAVGGFFGLTTEWPQSHSLTHRKGCRCRSYRRRLTERSGLITQNNDLTGSQRGHCMCILKTKYIQKALQRSACARLHLWLRAWSYLSKSERAHGVFAFIRVWATLTHTPPR